MLSLVWQDQRLTEKLVGGASAGAEALERGVLNLLSLSVALAVKVGQAAGRGADAFQEAIVLQSLSKRMVVV